MLALIIFLNVKPYLHHWEAGINYPDELPLALKKNKDETVITIKRFAALKFYEVGKLSLGQCAELAEMGKEEFLKFLGENKVTVYIFDSVQELENDIKKA